MTSSEPRLISGSTAAAYCGVTPATFSKWVATGIMPRPIVGTRRWDRRAIDRMLDKLSGITSPVTDEDPFEAWKREQEAGSSLEKWIGENEDSLSQHGIVPAISTAKR